MSSVSALLIASIGVILAIGLAYLPLRFLVGSIARSVRELIQRQRERRQMQRPTPDRRKAES